jgi:hypothetical protein
MYPEFSTLVSWWNARIKAECVEGVIAQEEKLKNETDPEKRKNLEKGIAMNSKIVNNINECPHQVVNADCGLIAYVFCGNSHLDAVPSDVNVDKFTVSTPNFKSTIRVIKHKGGSDPTVAAAAATVAHMEQLGHYKTLLSCL